MLKGTPGLLAEGTSRKEIVMNKQKLQDGLNEIRDLLSEGLKRVELTADTLKVTAYLVPRVGKDPIIRVDIEETPLHATAPKAR